MGGRNLLPPIFLPPWAGIRCWYYGVMVPREVDLLLSPRELAVLRDARRNTAVGQVLKRHWVPVTSTGRAPQIGDNPVRLHLLGEALVLFRDHDGRLGLIDAYCPHEGGSLAAGKVADGGLQCMLHGWAFAVTGQRVDGGATHQGASRTTAYPVREGGATVWAYLGEPGSEPALGSGQR